MYIAFPSRPSASLVLVLAACNPTPKGDSTDTGTDAGTSTAAEPMTDPGTVSGGTSSTGSSSTSAGTTDEPTTSEPTGTGTAGSSGSTTADATATDGATTDGTDCDLVKITTEHAHALGGDVLDCGVVDPWNNTAEEWQAVHACALEAAAAQKQFQLVVWLQGIDSTVGRGYVGVAARSYALEEIHFDTLGIPITGGRPCDGFSMIDGCTDFLGTPCLNCEGPGLGTTICDNP